MILARSKLLKTINEIFCSKSFNSGFSRLLNNWCRMIHCDIKNILISAWNNLLIIMKYDQDLVSDSQDRESEPNTKNTCNKT